MEIKDSEFGHFGWKMIAKQYAIPYIYRQNKEYVPLKLVRLFLTQMNIRLPDDLTNFTYIKQVPINGVEVNLMNEINHIHNDNKYPFRFDLGDTLVRIKDVENIVNFLIDCSEKLEYGDKHKSIKFGMVKIESVTSGRQFILPFVMKNNRRMVPLHLAIYLPMTSRGVPKDSKLAGIDLLYMKFLYRVCDMDVEWTNMHMSCVPLRILLRLAMVSDNNILFRDHWPDHSTYKSRFADSQSGDLAAEKVLNNNCIGLDRNAEDTETISSGVVDAIKWIRAFVSTKTNYIQ